MDRRSRSTYGKATYAISEILHQDQRARDAESASLCELALADEPMQGLLAHSITYRIAVGPRAGGRKVYTLQTLPPGDEGSGVGAGQVGGLKSARRRGGAGR